MIDTSRQNVAIAVNSEITLLYWKIGKRINEEVPGNEQTEYGKQVVAMLAKQLTEEYGKAWGEKQLRMCMYFVGVFALKREFYIEMCKLERWSSRQLQERIQSMLFERTAISNKPDELIEKELSELREENKVTPDLVFRCSLFLIFFGLQDKVRLARQLIVRRYQ
jgi:hypothetical protein